MDGVPGDVGAPSQTYRAMRRPMADSHMALVVSAAVTIVALGIFGYDKGRFSGARPVVSAVQTVVIGGIAATAAFLLARAIS
jgi:vacuolar iron transporter family protein